MRSRQKWRKILGEASDTIKTIVFGGQVAGSVLWWTDEEFGKPEVSYWLGKEHWLQGDRDTGAGDVSRARDAPSHLRPGATTSARYGVLEKCGFTRCGTSTAFANARGEEVEELILELR